MTEPASSAGRITAVRGDITEQAVDAIVNAANSTLMGGGGVDGAIHRKGGPAILEECRAIRTRDYPGGLPTGLAVITGAGKLPARNVIHTVGPIWNGGDKGEARLLGNAYASSLDIALRNGVHTVAFPSISTGAYGYPVRAAARVAVTAVRDWLDQHPGAIEEVRFVLFSEDDLKAYEERLDSTGRP